MRGGGRLRSETRYPLAKVEGSGEVAHTGQSPVPPGWVVQTSSRSSPHNFDDPTPYARYFTPYVLTRFCFYIKNRGCLKWLGKV